uniref:Sucrose-phosphate synthase/alpha-amylase n=1 Tax=Candidatus Kentrum sp. FM TaxID=2126340 RepID=A0A450T472_9GAMM|nr:MAG: sucrose-phosphate synthase/alpha-amylase [Candidatus Kentron sp. FM]VFJ61399.1 MAG: sucrose-phosphate synthase/alpha-amylase [Candidatus Kentron sp. FM]VFK13463.1 MAG: sucrose-phosphate synthase/alpha-amylase [Candidatus Kentron sp. FM]
MRIFDTFLFASDMDGTLLPNSTRGAAAGCLERTHRLLQQLKEAACPIVYITGRYLSLAREGQQTFKLPKPDYWVCNVGTEIYDSEGRPDAGWEKMLGPAFDRQKLLNTFKTIPSLVPQEDEKQGPHKFSLYYPKPVDHTLYTRISTQAKEIVDNIHLVSSVEELSGQSLLDLIPTTTGKAAALHYLSTKLGLPEDRVFFSGDSGNDFDALTSGVCGTLVGNAPEPVREQARSLGQNTVNSRLFVSRGYYGDGIIEGLLVYGLVGQ